MSKQYVVEWHAQVAAANPKEAAETARSVMMSAMFNGAKVKFEVVEIANEFATTTVIA